MSDESVSRERVHQELVTQRYGRSLTYLARTHSTNDDARAAAAAGAANGHVIIADAQDQGRGSRGRQWSSPPGRDLYFSIVDRPSVALPQLPPLTLAVGLGVAEAVDQILGVLPAPLSQVKWPNDVLLAHKKCAGILIEAVTQLERVEAVVIGIGLNLNREVFPVELVEQATSLRAFDPERREFDRSSALCTVLASVERWVDRFSGEGAAAIVSALSPRLALRGRRVRCDMLEGVLRGVDASGALQLETSRGLTLALAGRLEALDPEA